MRCLNFKLNRYHKGLYKGENRLILFNTNMLYGMSVNKYTKSSEFPHIVIGKKGDIFMFCPTHLTCGMGSDGIYIGFENFGRLEKDGEIYFTKQSIEDSNIRFEINEKNTIDTGNGIYDKYTDIQLEFFELLFGYLRPKEVVRLSEDSVSKAFPVYYYNSKCIQKHA